ncbi:hypothetical protein RclHR1_00110030 [Rhizophagus clarus]|uniref:Serine-threonine/tyrosine-protein kinase catalytic domain-containing protein n=1 Tax=Rhizophagus clarus TaxID=94130 RepID=A0A2Z6Q3F7_9GLOM|nr:hypothetical protein RclHR1_00110030 [Rhizophagus clarus]
MQCWDKDPKKRPTMDNVIRELERLWEDSLDDKLTIDGEGADDNGPEEMINKSLDNSRVHHNIIHKNSTYITAGLSQKNPYLIAR